MNSNFKATPFARNRPASRRSLLQLAGAVSLGAMALINAAPASAQDMSNGANNFYISDRVTVQKVTFKNQYQMKVAGNLFTPQGPDRNATEPGDRRRAPDGRGEGAEREPLRHEDGRAGLRRHVDRPVLLGRERGPAPQRGLAGRLRRGLQRRGRLPRHPAVRRPESDRRDRHLRQRQLRHQRGQDRPAPEGRSRRSACTTWAPPTATRSATRRRSSSASRSSRRRPSSATWSSPAARREYTGGTVHELTADTRPDPARVLRLLPHAARRVHAQGRFAAARRRTRR